MSSILCGEISASSSQARAKVLTSSERLLFITSLHFFGARDWLFSSILTLSSIASHPTYFLSVSAMASALYAVVGELTEGSARLVRFSRSTWRLVWLAEVEPRLLTYVS